MRIRLVMAFAKLFCVHVKLSDRNWTPAMDCEPLANSKLSR